MNDWEPLALRVARESLDHEKSIILDQLVLPRLLEVGTGEVYEVYSDS